MAAPPDTDTTISITGMLGSGVAFMAALGTILWNLFNYFRQKNKDTADAANWKTNVENLIAELRREIEHHKELDGLRHHNSEERLTNAEKQLDEILKLLIQVYQESGGDFPSARPRRRP